MNTQAAVMTETLPFTLPNIRGRYAFGFDLSKATWFKVGGAAEVLFKPKDAEDLVTFIKNKDPMMPVTMLGAGSNVLVRDGGIKGVVVKLGSGFSEIIFHGTEVIVGGACLDRTFVLACAEKGLSGVEFLVGVPGTIGGAVAMNAGAYGGEVKNFIKWVEIIGTDGALTRLQAADLSMKYRKGNLPKGAIIVRASFILQNGAPEAIHARINAYLQQREDTQPVRGRTGGSTFKNPTDMAAWKLIDQAGCRGLMIGDAQVSEKHCNFLLNLDAAKAADLEQLGEHVWQAVKEKCGVELEWEIIRLGE
ncbi:MAG: UDP-N-acetylmuramate dehydrogenase [Alphaproteobacteria bacterium]|nr:UDP-N-acetylmuramate dehydrogenase [Alphaproteobacteria bacterium]